jgi:hypothetical protein
MANIDTLQMYKEYLEGGYTEAQAMTAVKSLGVYHSDLATKEDLLLTKNEFTNGLQMLEKDLKIFFVYSLGSTLLVGFILPIIVAIVLKYFRII